MVLGKLLELIALRAWGNLFELSACGLLVLKLLVLMIPMAGRSPFEMSAYWLMILEKLPEPVHLVAGENSFELSVCGLLVLVKLVDLKVGRGSVYLLASLVKLLEPVIQKTGRGFQLSVYLLMVLVLQEPMPLKAGRDSFDLSEYLQVMRVQLQDQQTLQAGTGSFELTVHLLWLLVELPVMKT